MEWLFIILGIIGLGMSLCMTVAIVIFSVSASRYFNIKAETIEKDLKKQDMLDLINRETLNTNNTPKQ